MSIHVRNEDQPTVIAISGELDLLESAAVAAVIEAVDGPVIVDASGLTFCDIAGVRALCSADRVEGARSNVARVFQLLGLGEMLGE